MIFYILIPILIFLVYLPWFEFSKTLSSGDWPYLFLQNIQAFKILTETPFLWLEPYYQLTAKLSVQVFSLHWEAAEKIFWFFPFLIVSLISSYFFLKYLLKQFKIDANKTVILIPLGCLIFTTNTYILMLVGGGQMGVAMGYSLVPLIIRTAFKVYQEKLSLRKIILYAFLFGLQMMFDPRIFLLSIGIAFLYILFTSRDLSAKILKRIFLVLGLTIVSNLFWILPNFGYFNTEYKAAIDAVNADYLSFAAFSNSISLLHPNWPENIFGKIGFMKPEFIILPILAFLTLLFINKNKNILFFAFLGIFGAFFAKGTNPPFGELYSWLSNFPGFSIFRDPTKFYILVVISYMVLIPISIYYFVDWLKLKLQLQIKNYGIIFFSLTFCFYWLFLIRPAVLQKLTGTFKPHDVPEEYIGFKDFLYKQPEFTKTLWIPSIERFGFNSRAKPAISAMELFGVSSTSGVLDKFDTENVKKQLMDEEVKYIIVPYDFLKEIFLTERKYNDILYIDTVNKLRNINWLSEINSNNFGKIKIFEISRP